jgi:hypothetical protein
VKTLVALGTAAWVLAAARGAGAADWLPGRSRAVTYEDSAAPSVPVASYAYGPRARATLGGDVAFVALRNRRMDFRLGGSALFAFENARGARIVPDQTFESIVELGAAWAFPGAADPLSRTLGTLELAVTLGNRSAHRVSYFELGDRIHTTDVPFGAGGSYLGVELAARSFARAPLVLTPRLGLRLFTNLFPDLVGQRVASDVVADALREGAEFMGFLELDARWVQNPRAQPLLGLYTDAILPHDDSAHQRWLGRFLLGVAFPGSALELTPFVDGELGHGQGLLVNRTEARLGAGVRLDAR